MPSSITAIFVTYNSADVIADALKALSQESLVGRIIVVDNASVDATRDLVKEHCPQAVLIENPTNEGYGRANNIALERVATDYALLVNPDAILKDGAIAALLAAAERNPDAAIIAPQLMDENGKLHRGSYKRSVFAREQARDYYYAPEGDLCAEFISGAVWLLNMQKLRQIGFFDPAIFLYYEDDDFCMRARAEGFSLVQAHDACAVHLMGASSGKPKPASEWFKQKQMTWSRLYIEEKYHGEKAAKKLTCKLYISYLLRALGYALLFNTFQLARYRGRLAGIHAFNAPAIRKRAPGR